MVERARAQPDQDLSGACLGVGDVLVPQDVGASVLVDSYGFQGTMSSMTGAELSRLAEELGLDAVGAAPVEAYTETERHIRERRDRGLFADMQFTMAKPEVSCHPETLLAGARTVVSAALCYYAPAPEQPDGTGRLPRYTWRHAYAELREKLDALGRALGGEYRVLVDENDHVDREAAARAGVGFYGKNTLMITRRHGSWVVLGTLVTEAELDATPPLGDRLRRVPPLRRRVPDRGARRAGRPRLDALPLLLDAVTHADPGRVQGAARGPRLRLRHLPGRLPVEPRRREAPRRRAARRGLRLARRLARGRRRGAAHALRPPLRPAQRPALPPPQRARRRGERGR